jgi:hypothetical protein
MKDTKVVDVRPSAVLNVGITGHRDLLPTEALEASIGQILSSLEEAVQQIVALNPDLFDGTPAKLRVISMAAQGADLLSVRAALAGNFDVACIMPFRRQEYAIDFDEPNRAEMERAAEAATAVLELPGTREEGARAYERANDVILENIDILLALWDGDRARGRAGTAEVVERAITMNLGVIVIDPADFGHPKLLELPDDRNLSAPRAADLRRIDLPTDLTAFVGAALANPGGTIGRQAFLDLVKERRSSFARRFEYRLLLDIFANSATSEAASEPAAEGQAAQGSDVAKGELLELARKQNAIDSFAIRYGELFRSSSASRYLLVILGTFTASMISLFFPKLSGSAIAVQAVVNGTVLLDSAIGGARRWHERWLEYRVIAQRLDWIRVLHPLGFGTGQSIRERQGSWATWYVTRLTAAIGPPSGAITGEYLTRAADRLQSYAHQQVTYHRAKLHQLGLLETRLRTLSVGALIGAVVIALSLMVAVEVYGALLGWKPAVIVLLTILPATTTALNGLRAEMDLVRLIERSAETSVLLSRINRAISDGYLSFDRLSVGTHRLTTIMDDELREWRFVLESRRARTGLKRMPWLKRLTRNFGNNV